MATMVVDTITLKTFYFFIFIASSTALMNGNRPNSTCLEVIPGLQYSCYRRNLTYVPASFPSTTEHLDFSFNYLKTLQRGVLPSLPSLMYLDLTRCSIQHIYSDAFISTRNLSVFILTGNPIRCLGKSSFNILTRMQKLVLVDTGLPSLDSLNLQNAISLRELQVGRNNIFSIALPMYAFSFKDFAVLDLHSNNISVIRAVHTSVLRSIGSNITLILYSNPISFIEAGAFNGLVLKELDVIDTFTSSAIMKNAIGNLSGLSVKTLRIGGFQGSSRSIVYTDSVDSLCVIHFQEIYFYQPARTNLHRHALGCTCMSKCSKIILNRVNLDLSVPFPLNDLKEIVIIHGKLFRLLGPLLSHQHSLKKLVISDNQRVTPAFERIEDLPSLEYVDLSNNNLIMECCYYQFTGTPKLKYLNLSMNADVRLTTHGLSSLSSLEIFDLSHTKVKLGQLGPIDLSKLVKLKYFDLSFSHIQFKISIFTGLNSLQELKLAGNTFQKDIFSQMFSNLTKLEVLDISSCAIEDIPWNSFDGLHHLKHLEVSGNRLGTLNFLTHPSLSNLVSFYADGNNIATISPSVFHNLSSNLLQFDLSFNPIECSCSSSEFIFWIINHQSVLKNPDQLSCKGSLESSNVLDFDPTHCIHIKTVKFLVPIFAVVMSLLLSVLVYKFQFHLRYCCRLLLRGYRTASTQEYSYDAFVIYSSKDDVWVQNELKENLEKGFPPVQLCLHERDFQAGKSISSNIVDEGIISSRKVIVVVSQHFIDSSWCRFEFELAQSWFVLGQSARIILIILEDVEDKNIRKVFGLHKYLKRNTYLKWKGNAFSDMRFWTRLRKAIIAN